jgi:uncharacterized protein YjbI with pentapeptide repeats
MANEDHLKRLRKGVDAWNVWREDTSVRADLGRADLGRADLSGADLSRAGLRGANLSGAHLGRADLLMAGLTGADLSGANLSGAHFGRAYLSEANLSGADLSWTNLSGAFFREANLSAAKLSGAGLGRANLSGANLSRAQIGMANLFEANLSGADLSEASFNMANLIAANLRKANLNRADLSGANLVEADLTDADLIDCHVYGISAWKLKLDGAKQQNLVIADFREPKITVDSIEVAQFVYLLLNNKKICDVIDTITSKVVLILGCFTSERKAVLDALRDELRRRNYLPILFDFDKPTSQTVDETVTLLARMARFVIADISDAKSVLQELRAIVPDIPSLPVQPLIVATQEEPGMFDFFRRYPWVLEAHRYDTQEQLIANLGKWVIGPAEAKVLELRGAKLG